MENPEKSVSKKITLVELLDGKNLIIKKKKLKEISDQVGVLTIDLGDQELIENIANVIAEKLNTMSQKTVDSLVLYVGGRLEECIEEEE